MCNKLCASTAQPPCACRVPGNFLEKPVGSVSKQGQQNMVTIPAHTQPQACSWSVGLQAAGAICLIVESHLMPRLLSCALVLLCDITGSMPLVNNRWVACCHHAAALPTMWRHHKDVAPVRVQVCRLDKPRREVVCTVLPPLQPAGHTVQALSLSPAMQGVRPIQRYPAEPYEGCRQDKQDDMCAMLNGVRKLVHSLWRLVADTDMSCTLTPTPCCSC